MCASLEGSKCHWHFRIPSTDNSSHLFEQRLNNVKIVLLKSFYLNDHWRTLAFRPQTQGLKHNKQHQNKRYCYRLIGQKKKLIKATSTALSYHHKNVIAHVLIHLSSLVIFSYTDQSPIIFLCADARRRALDDIMHRWVTLITMQTGWRRLSTLVHSIYKTKRYLVYGNASVDKLNAMSYSLDTGNERHFNSNFSVTNCCR